MKSLLSLFLILGTGLTVVAQYAPQAGVAGSDAISKDDKRIIAWATTCVVERGWLDIADKSQGTVTLGLDESGTGRSDNTIVSLGDSGTAVLTFSAALYNGPGPDFAVFENSFVNPNNPEEAFIELAFVEVSSDGSNYVRFPASSLTDTPQVPVAGVYMNARKINNLAGKYRGGYGVPFDLEELKGTPGLDVDHITHIRIVDVIGSLGANGTTDKDGNKINDPYPTAVIGGGFDLDAVGVLSIPGWWPSGVTQVEVKPFHIFPNPATDVLNITTELEQTASVSIADITGRKVISPVQCNKHVKVGIGHLVSGIYYLILNDETGKEWVTRFAKY